MSITTTTTSTENNQGNTCQTNAIADNKHSQNNAAQGRNNPNLPPSIKGRGASKLSSRHNRRKRRSGGEEGRSAKKPRSKRNNTTERRVPIPSFAPIKGVMCDVKGTERVGEACEKVHDASDDTSKNNSHSHAPLSGDTPSVKADDAIIDSSNPTLKYTGEESQDEVIDKSDPCNKDQVYTKMFEGQNTTHLPKENNVLLHKIKRIDIQEGKKDRETNDSLTAKVVGEGCTENQMLLAQVTKKPQSGESTLKSSCFPLNKARSSSSVAEHGDNELCTNTNNGKGNSKRSEYSDTKTQSELPADNVIEILDDDENDVGNGAAAKCDSVKSEMPAKRSATTANRNDAPSKKKKTNTKSTAGNQTKKKATTRKRDQTSTKEVKSENCSNDVEQKKVAEKKKKKGKKLCFACSSCTCATRSGTDATPQKLSALSGSDARQEQTLVNRLQRIERNIAWNEGQRNDVARQLKKRRGQMLKKYQSSCSSQKPRFLADVEVSDELGGLCSYNNIDLKEINHANNRVFGEGAQKSKFFGEYYMCNYPSFLNMY